MKKLIIAGVVLLCAAAFAQEKAVTPEPGDYSVVPSFSQAEQLHIRILELAKMKTQTAKQAAIAQLPQTQADDRATYALQDAMDALFKLHKVDLNKQTICDGPNPADPLCKDVKPDELAVRNRPKPKKEEKKPDTKDDKK